MATKTRVSEAHVQRVLAEVQAGQQTAGEEMTPEGVQLLARQVRGEITVVVEGAIRPAADLETEVAGIRDRVARGERLKDVCGEVSRATGLSRKALYDAVVARPSAG